MRFWGLSPQPTQSWQPRLLGFPRTFLYVQGVWAAGESFMNKHGSSQGYLKEAKDLGSSSGFFTLDQSLANQVTSCVTLDMSCNHSVAQLSHKKQTCKIEPKPSAFLPISRGSCGKRHDSLSSVGTQGTMMYPGMCSFGDSHQHVGSPTFGAPQILQCPHPAQSARRGSLCPSVLGSMCCYRALKGTILPTPPPDSRACAPKPACEKANQLRGRARMCHPLKIIPLI